LTNLERMSQTEMENVKGGLALPIHIEWNKKFKKLCLAFCGKKQESMMALPLF